MTHQGLTRRGVGYAATLVMLGLVAPGPAGARAAAAAAIDPGGVPWTWGGNSFGQLGNGTTTARRTPGPVTGLADVVDLHGGREHVAALRADGTVWVWGSNQQGQLGLGDSDQPPDARPRCRGSPASPPSRPGTTTRWRSSPTAPSARGGSTPTDSSGTARPRCGARPSRWWG